MTEEEKWLRFYSDSIFRMVHWGKLAYQSVMNNRNYKATDVLPGIIYLKTFFEIIDAIGLNIEHGITTSPTKSLVRSATEHFFGAIYLTKSIENFSKYSLAISFISIIEEKKGFEPFFSSNINDTVEVLNEVFGNSVTAGSFDYSKTEKFYETILSHSDFAEVSEEFYRSKAKKAFKNKKIVPWYSLWDGPIRISDLADKANMKMYYDTIYKEFSLYTHGSKTFESNKVHKGEDNGLYLLGHRTPYDLKFVSTPPILLCKTLIEQLICVLDQENTSLKAAMNNEVLSFLEINPPIEPINYSDNTVLSFPDQ